MLPIYVDLDDVLCDTARGLLNLLQREFGKALDYEAITSFDLQLSLGLGRREFDHFFELAHEPHELLTYTPIPQALAALAQWSLAGHTVTVVTGRPEGAREASLEWLAAHKVNYDHFLVVDKYRRGKSGGNGTLSMAQLSAMKFTLAVEDAPEMALHLAGAMQTPVALMDRPWNRQLNGVERITRVRSWAQVQPGEIVELPAPGAGAVSAS